MPNAQLNKKAMEHKETSVETAKGEIKIPDSYLANMTYADIIAEFPKLVRGGQFVNAMVVIQGHSRFLWFYQLLEKVTRKITGRKAAVAKKRESVSVKSEKASWYGSLKTLAEESEKESVGEPAEI